MKLGDVKFGDIKLEEFLRVMLTATLVVVGVRFLFYYGNGSPWLRQPFGNPWITAANQPTALPVNTPPTVINANRSVVMLEGNQSIGSGVILTTNGLVLTNSHVIRNGGNQWTVRLANSQVLPARVVAVGNREAGIYYDLALVQIEGVTNLPVAQFSDVQPRTGELVWAIGAPYGRADVITQGELKQVTQDGILLTTTEVHPGNSGGPLLNQNGEIIGINTEINPSMPDNATTASISVGVLEQYLPQLLN